MPLKKKKKIRKYFLYLCNIPLQRGVRPPNLKEVGMLVMLCFPLHCCLWRASQWFVDQTRSFLWFVVSRSCLNMYSIIFIRDHSYVSIANLRVHHCCRQNFWLRLTDCFHEAWVELRYESLPGGRPPDGFSIGHVFGSSHGHREEMDLTGEWSPKVVNNAEMD